MSLERHKLLIVDDEPALRRALRTSLTGSEFDVMEARTGDEALAAMRSQPSDVVLLDINMPGMSGFEVCRRIRASSPRVGVIMVTVRDAEEDKVHALEAGADDFVTKPYRLRELVARVRAVMRRLDAGAQPQETLLQAGALEMDMERRRLTKSGVEIRLSPKEFDLLAYFLRHQGGPILHAKLLKAVWGPEYGGELEYLRSYVKMLRKKIEDDPANPEYLLTEPWVGYRFRNPADAQAAVAEGG